MRGEKLGLVAFAIGVFLMHALITVNFWLIVVGVFPDATVWGILPATSRLGGLAWALGPPVGAVLMVLGGLIYGRGGKEVVR